MFFFQAEDGIRDLVRSRGLGDVYKRQEEQAKKQLVKVVPDETLSAGSDVNAEHPLNMLLKLVPFEVSNSGMFCRAMQPLNMPLKFVQELNLSLIHI